METAVGSRRSEWAEAGRMFAPLAMGYIPVGIAYGVLAQKAGISVLNTVLMSLIVYAGSAQLIAVGMLAAGMPALSIVLTTFIVNLRHLLMSAALAPYMRRWTLTEMLCFSFEMTDETFAVHSVRFAEDDRRKAVSFRMNVLAHCVWIVASWVGALAGGIIPDVKPLGMDFVLPGMFMALLAMQAKNGLHWFVAGFSGLVAVVLLQAGFEQWSVVAATVLGATLGAGVELWNRD